MSNKINFIKYNNSDKAFIIAEIGNNHQGDLEKAFMMIDEAAKAGVDAVKFQKRHNKTLYSYEMYNAIYDNENSFGKTYGQHREFLELDIKYYNRLIKRAKKNNLKFIVTPFDFHSLEQLEKLDVDAYKIASADLVNIPHIETIIKTKKPIIFSTGHSELKDIKIVQQMLLNYKKKNYCFLHCTAAYPANIEDLNLNFIKILKKRFPNISIGLSDHENGIDAGPIAYMLGARIFEKHFTLNRSFKGTDHAFSIEPNGLRKFVRNIRRVPIMLGSFEKKILKSEIKPIFKMRKSIYLTSNRFKGEILSKKDLGFRSPGDGIPPNKIEKIIGKKLKKNKFKNDLLSLNDF